MADSKLSALSEISAPALEDLLYTVDDPSGTPVSNKVSGTRYGGLLARAAFGYRLTTESGVPVSTSDRTSQSTIYLTPDPASQFCRFLSLYDGTRWKLYTNAEISLALSGLTSGKNYDVFVYDNAGTLTLELSASWTNDTTRADALTTQDGIYVKSGSTTRRYVGTIRTTSTTATEDSLAKRFVWNMHNRVIRTVRGTLEGTNSWSYSSTTIRQANASTANQFEVVVGLAGGMVYANVNVVVNPSGASAGWIGIGYDSTTAFTTGCVGNYTVAQSAAAGVGISSLSHQPSLGYHYYAWLEKTNGGSCTFLGDDGGNGIQSGITGIWEA